MPALNVALLSPGEMGQAVGARLVSGGVRVRTWYLGDLEQKARAMGIEVVTG